MAPQEKLRRRISDLVERPNNVDIEEVEWVLKQLNASCRQTKHGVIFCIPGCSRHLMLNRHNNGKSHLPLYCVYEFRNRMCELGLYELEESNDED
jgi:hypothetical protein